MADVEGEIYGGVDMGSEVSIERQESCLRERDVAQASSMLFRGLNTCKTW